MNWVGEVAEVHYYVLMKDEQVYINLNEFRSDINSFGTNCYINMRLTTKALTKQKGPKCFLGCSKNTCIFFKNATFSATIESLPKPADEAVILR